MSRFDAVVAALSTAPAGRDSCRLLHGRGRCHPGLEHLSVDRFHPVILVTLFREESGLDELVGLLRDWGRAEEISCIAVQHRYQRDSPLSVAWGELPRKPMAEEAGLRFGITLGGRQNPGFFLDMAEARRWVTAEASGRRVLNLFAYTCAFSVVARSAGASQVVNLDMAGTSLRTGEQNHARNGLVGGVKYLPHDLFRSWGKLSRLAPFDLIIVDPPTRQPGSFVAEQDYPRLIAKLPGLCAAGADILLCLNSPHLGTGFLLDSVGEQAPGLRFEERLPNPAAFRDIDEDASLKVLRFSCAESM